LLPKLIKTLLACLIVSGCGFDPIYGNRGQTTVNDEFTYISVASIKNRIGQRLRNNLLHQLQITGPLKEKKYDLIVELEESIQSLAVRKSAFATRANLTVTAKYVLMSAVQPKTLLQSSENVTVSYNIYNSKFATLVAHRNAHERAIRSLSKDIVISLAIYFERQKNPSPKHEN